ADFGEQWTAYPDSDGFFGSVELFDDIFHPLVSARDVAGLDVAEIGAGLGRFINILAEAGAGGLFALEPANPFPGLRGNPSETPPADHLSERDRRSSAGVRGPRLRVHHRRATPHS